MIFFTLECILFNNVLMYPIASSTATSAATIYPQSGLLPIGNEALLRNKGYAWARLRVGESPRPNPRPGPAACAATPPRAQHYRNPPFYSPAAPRLFLSNIVYTPRRPMRGLKEVAIATRF